MNQEVYSPAQRQRGDRAGNPESSRSRANGVWVLREGEERGIIRTGRRMTASGPRH